MDKHSLHARNDEPSPPNYPIADSSPIVLQFGTGRFLRGFVDFFVHEINQASRAQIEIAAVQSIGADRANQLNQAGGRYHLAIRGLINGCVVDEKVAVSSIRRALTAQKDWSQVADLARCRSLVAIVSNATEAGYALDSGDGPGGSPPRSFPAKLLTVLAARFHARLPGVAIFPCELLEHNADRLRRLVLEQAALWQFSRALVDWLCESCTWHNTLVDRIVSAPRADDPMVATDPLFAVAEPFALWLIEGRTGALFGSHSAVQSVETLEPYYLRKVRILNGAHTALVAQARPLGFETVREAVLDPVLSRWLKQLVFEEIVPTLEGRTDQPERFAQQCLERLANPFLDHRLADIALAHETKVRARLVPTYEEFRARFGREPRLLREIVSRPG